MGLNKKAAVNEQNKLATLFCCKKALHLSKRRHSNSQPRYSLFSIQRSLSLSPVNMALRLLHETQNSASFQMTCHAIIVLTPLTDGAAPRLRRREMEKKRPIHRWPGWECIGSSTRTLLPCPVGLRPLAVTGLIAAKNRNLDQCSTTEAGERARETTNKCGIKAHANMKWY